MEKYCSVNMQKTSQLLQNISDEDYVLRIAALSGSSIGQHVRHIIEFFQCLLNQAETGVVNYDKRERNMLLETEKNQALNAIHDLNNRILQISHLDFPLQVHACFSGNETQKFNSSLMRELAYCFEHSIHHQALIAVALTQIQGTAHVDSDFGYAPSTIAYHQANR